MGFVIIGREGLIATHDSRETQGNKDVEHDRLVLRQVKCGMPFTLIRNMDAE